MIISKIVGELENQIACYAFGWTCARRLGVQLKLDITAFENSRLHKYSLGHFFLEAEIASDEEIAHARSTLHIFETTPPYDPEVRNAVRDGCYLEGDWSDFRYTEESLEEFRRCFLLQTPLDLESELIKRKILESSSASLHVPRGQCYRNSNYFQLPLSYYEEALTQVLGAIPNVHFYVFSDDLDWVKSNLKIHANHTWVGENDSSRNFIDFELIRSCQNHVIANTPFSLWAAHLGESGANWVPQQYFKLSHSSLPSISSRISQPVWPPKWHVIPLRVSNIRAVDYANLPGGYSDGPRIRVAVTGLYEEALHGGKIFKNPEAPIGAELHRPWCELFRHGACHGIDYLTVDQFDSSDTIDAAIFIDRPRSSNHFADSLLQLRIPKYLVIYECEVIRAENWDLAYHAHFDRIFTWNDNLIDNIRYFKLTFSLETTPRFDFNVLKSAFEQRRLITMIAGGKFTKHPNELYSARINAINWYEKNAPDAFDLHGPGWPGGVLKTWRGAVSDKLGTLAKYRFCICFENASGYAGYITEKLLDCLVAGVVPVYLGAPNVTDWVPSTCFIDYRTFKDFEQLHAFLSGMSAPEHGSYLDAISLFLSSESSYPFSIDRFVTSLSSHLARDVKRHQQRQPRISIAIPTYNQAAYLELAVERALTQDIDSLEVIIVDNASNDGTSEIATNLARSPRVRYMRQNSNIGAAQNWQTAAAVASGTALVMLSSDDFFLEGHLRRALDALDRHPNASLVYSPVITVNELGLPGRVLFHPAHPGVDYCGGRNEFQTLLSMDCYVTPSAAVIRREDFDRVGGFRSGIRAALDWDLWIRMSAQGGDFLFYRLPSVCYRFHQQQDTIRAVMSGDLLTDHVNIVNHVLLNYGFESLGENHRSIAALLAGKVARQGGAVPSEVVGRAHSLINLLTSKSILES
jgi:hypothetical protein